MERREVGLRAGLPADWAADLLLVSERVEKGRRPSMRDRAATLAVSVLFRAFGQLAVAAVTQWRRPVVGWWPWGKSRPCHRAQGSQSAQSS